jgi:FkbM family methyltransferase
MALDISAIIAREKESLRARRASRGPTVYSSPTGPVRAACVHLANPTGDHRDCHTCTGPKSLPVHSCLAAPGICTPGGVAAGVQSCLHCRYKEVPFPIRFDEHTLCPGVPGKRFNTSIIDWGGYYVLAFRNGWRGSDVYITFLNRKFTPVGRAVKLDLSHPECAYGREDPRLFVFRGKLHVTFSGVVGTRRDRGTIKHTTVLYARLSDTFKVERTFYPHFSNRNSWEKNWVFFEYGGELFATYSIAPHRILRIDGDRAEMVYETPTCVPWSGGEMRGGSSPVKIGDEFWHFFHDRIESGGHRIYRTGLCTFDAKPPFRIRRLVTEPLLTANPATKPVDQYASVVFPCGAVRDGDNWVVSHGIHDRWTELHRWSHADLESRMSVVGPPDWWALREGTADRPIWTEVITADCYGLRTLDLTGMAVLDVGAHIGTFAHAACARGASLVHCYEPFPSSADLLEQNALRIGEVRVFREAVGAGRGIGRFANAAELTATGGWTVVPDPAGVSPIVGLDEAILRLAKESPSGRIGLLKMDCEGGEWPALENVTRLDLVDRVVGEYHPAPGTPGRDAAGLVSLLRRHKFEVVTRETGDTLGVFSGVRSS